MERKTIDCVYRISEKEFKENYFYPQKPLVIKGLAKDYPAGKKWSLDYIKNVCGDVDVDVFDNSNLNKESAFTKPDLKMKFRTYMDEVMRDEPSTLRLFLVNMFKARPELRKDFPCPELMRGILGRMGFLFFGAKGIKVRIHQDMDMSNVLLTQFYGRKKVVLISPQYSDLLYKLPLNTHSLVDLDKPDYKKYPGLRYIQMQECLLEPGDAIFMPSGYWHYMTYEDAGFSVSYRKIAIEPGLKVRGFLNVFVFMPFDKFLNKLFGKNWLLKKEKLAERRANKAIQKLRQKHGQRYFAEYQMD